jgi:phage shock protein C
MRWLFNKRYSEIFAPYLIEVLFSGFQEQRRSESMYCTNCGKDIGEGPTFCQFCGIRVAPLPPIPKRPFARVRADKKIAGVCAGVARYFDLDPTLVRAIWLLSTLFAGTGLLVYIVLWIVMPLDPENPTLPE